MARLHALLQKLKEASGSDLHLIAGAPPKMRIHGKIVAMDDQPPLTAEFLKEILCEILRPDQVDTYGRKNDLDFAYHLPGVARFRCNYFVQNKGPAAVFRLVPEVVPSLKDLDLPPVLSQIADYTAGLILVTGPGGSGRSTTMAALINEINHKHPRHIITIEEQIEFVHKPKRSLISQREVGLHCQSSLSALKAAMHEDPDVIMLGDIRDVEVIKQALITADMGFLVIGTFHTNLSSKTIERLIDAFPSTEQVPARTLVASCLAAVIGQLLIKGAGGGRCAANEVLMCNPAVSSCIREDKLTTIKSIIEGGRSKGMMMMDDSLEKLVKENKADPDDAYLKAVEKQRFQKYRVHKLSVG